MVGSGIIVAVYSGITRSDYEKLSKIAPTVAQSGKWDDYETPWSEMTRTASANRCSTAVIAASALSRRPSAVPIEVDFGVGQHLRASAAETVLGPRPDAVGVSGGIFTGRQRDGDHIQGQDRVVVHQAERDHALRVGRKLRCAVPVLEDLGAITRRRGRGG